ncbi:MAG TPA: 3'-5' exonuclease [Candidatus Binatia bacterium]|nr:3'-5' exonuclease [Candidatus Binatia bacterium]
MKEPVLVFDIETVPDAESGRRILGLDGLDDAAVVQAMAAQRLAARGSDFQPAYLQRIVAISAALRTADSFRVWSLGEPDSSEAELVQRFFDGIEKYRPVLVSWNGSGFDLPVLHYRALKHACAAPKYWDTGHLDRESKWDNYLGRYQFRHTDLMDVLALYNGRNYAPLDDIARMLGLPGKLGMDGSQVHAAWAAGRIGEIRAYCETDVLNTWLIYLRFQRLRGQLDPAAHAAEIERVRAFLHQSPEPHWAQFLQQWSAEC